MQRENIKVGQIVRILTKWHGLPSGTIGTVETVTNRWDGTKVFTVCWHTQSCKDNRPVLYQNNIWETDLDRFEAVAAIESVPMPALPKKRPLQHQLRLPFEESEFGR